MCRVEPSRVSSSSAWPARQRSEADWSIPPVAAPAISFSARMQISASRARPASLDARPSSCTSSSATATALSSAAEEDSPAPYGTQESTTTSNPCTGCPASRRDQATPAT